MLISGIPMHRIKGTDPWRDTQSKIKAFGRVGMGPCQGRVCGPALALLRGWEADRVRPPLRVSTLGVLASRSKGPAGH